MEASFREDVGSSAWQFILFIRVEFFQQNGQVLQQSNKLKSIGITKLSAVSRSIVFVSRSSETVSVDSVSELFTKIKFELFVLSMLRVLLYLFLSSRDLFWYFWLYSVSDSAVILMI